MQEFYILKAIYILLTSQKPIQRMKQQTETTYKIPETRRCGGDSGGGHRRRAFFGPFFAALGKERTIGTHSYIYPQMDDPFFTSLNT